MENENNIQMFNGMFHYETEVVSSEIEKAFDVLILETKDKSEWIDIVDTFLRRGYVWGGGDTLVHPEWYDFWPDKTVRTIHIFTKEKKLLRGYNNTIEESINTDAKGDIAVFKKDTSEAVLNLSVANKLYKEYSHRI